MYKKNLSFATLIKTMHEVIQPYGRTTHRDTIADIADLAESQIIAVNNDASLTRFWTLKFTGTFLTRTADLSEWQQSDIEAQFKITWSPESNWTIEDIL